MESTPAHQEAVTFALKCEGSCFFFMLTLNIGAEHLLRFGIVSKHFQESEEQTEPPDPMWQEPVPWVLPGDGPPEDWDWHRRRSQTSGR